MRASLMLTDRCYDSVEMMPIVCGSINDHHPIMTPTTVLIRLCHVCHFRIRQTLQCQVWMSVYIHIISLLIASQFDRLHWFTDQVKWRLIFDINVSIRDKLGGFNMSNVHRLLDYAQKQHYRMDFELGNGK
jgi:hypothetical protein